MLHRTIFLASSSFNPRSLTMITVDQLIAEQKSNVQVAFGLAGKTFEGVEKLVELNLTAARASLSESSDYAKSVISAKDVQQLLALQAAALQPLAEKAAAYNRHVADIAQATAAEYAKVVEAQAAEAQAKFAALVDNAAQNAPAGFETPVAIVKSAMAAASNSYESVQKAVKQATDLAQANIDAVTAQATGAVKSASKKR
jgi:phasin family protein